MAISRITEKILLFVLLICMLGVSPADAQDVKKIMVIPFEVYSSHHQEDIRNSLYQNLCGALQKEQSVHVIAGDEYFQNHVRVDEEKAIDRGKSVQADFVIIGSLVQFGEAINLDAKVIDVTNGTILATTSAQSKGLAALEATVDELKKGILSSIGMIQTISKVEIRGNHKISAESITEKIKSRKDGNFSEADIADDIKTIFKMGFFLDVTAEASFTTEGKVVIFTVLEKGLISDIKISGNKSVNKDDIQGVLTIKKKQNVNPEQVKRDIEKIKALYDNKGYYNAEIKDRIEPDGEKDFRVILDIKEHNRLYIKTISFEGNEAYTSKELKKLMSTSEKGFFSFITDSGLLKRDQLKQDVGRLNAYYFNNGFINAQIGEPDITIDKKAVRVKIKVKEGKRFKIDNVAISGDTLEKSREDLWKSLKVKKGENYNREAVIRDIDFLTHACNDEGYAHADINPRVNTRENEQMVDVDYQIHKGEQVYIEHINIYGNNITRDKVIRRQLDVVEGDLYSSSKLRSSYAKLNRLRYFEEVDFQTDKGLEKDKMDINVRVKEKSTGMFMIGAGYSAADQAMVMAQITQQNFLGYGQILNLKASLSSSTNSYDLSFTEPWLFDIPLWMKADIWRYKREYDYYDLDSVGGGLTLGYPLWGKIVGYLGYKYYIDNVTNVSSFASDYVKEQEGETITSAVTVSLIRDTTDDFIFPSKGTKTSLSVTYAGGPLQGEADYTQYSASLFSYFPLPLSTVFVAKGRIGYIQEHEGEEIPVSIRYVLGGINSLRGFRYVGATNAGSNNVIGGNSMLVFNVELVFPFIKDSGMKVVAFYDAGNSWDDKYDLGDLRQSVGLGIRWYSPIGPLRLEYGRVINRGNLDDHTDGRWEFTIGMPM